MQSLNKEEPERIVTVHSNNSTVDEQSEAVSIVLPPGRSKGAARDQVLNACTCQQCEVGDEQSVTNRSEFEEFFCKLSGMAIGIIMRICPWKSSKQVSLGTWKKSFGDYCPCKCPGLQCCLLNSLCFVNVNLCMCLCI